MKQILVTLALIALALSFASCDKTCNCNCACCNTNGSDQTIQRPDNSGSGSGNNGGTTDDNTDGNTGENEGTTDGIDRSGYDVYNHTMTQGFAGYYGAFYDDQPTNTANWYIALGESNYDFEAEETEGDAIFIELFTSSSYTTSIPSGTYTVEAFDKEAYSPFSLLNGFIDEDDSAMGTWLCEGVYAIAGATVGKVTVSNSGSKYNITYDIHDDEYQISFKGTFTGILEFYDGTQESSYVSAASARKNVNSVRHYRIRK